MNTEKAMLLFDAVTGVREDYVLEAEAPRPRHRVRMIAAVAACFCILVGALVWSVSRGLPLVPPGGASAGGGGRTEGSYHYYAGPVLPLAAAEGGEGLTAERSVELDLTSYRPESTGGTGPVRYRNHCLVTDRYLLSAEDGEARTVILLYPFVAALSDERALLPTVTADGAKAETELLIGPGRIQDGRLELSSWEDCQALMEEDYALRARAALPELSETVTVYELSDLWCGEDADAVNPTLDLCFRLDPEKSAVLTYGFAGGSNDKVTGTWRRHTDITRPGAYGYGRSRLLIVLGEDIRELRVEAYTDGGCETPLADAGGTVTRYESTLGEIVARAWNEWRSSPDHDTLTLLADTETLTGLTAVWMLQRDPVAGSGIPYGEMGDWNLEDAFSGVRSQSRVLYLRFTVAIPAGETAEIEAKLLKYPSLDHDHRGKAQERRNGYDLAVQLGSEVRFTALEASLKGWEYVTILRQDFGFDPENGVLRVALDPEKEHYFLEVTINR